MDVILKFKKLRLLEYWLTTGWRYSEETVFFVEENSPRYTYSESKRMDIAVLNGMRGCTNKILNSKS